MTYLANARLIAPAAFADHFNRLDFGKASWTPRLFVLHNTEQPSLKQWLDGGDTPEQRLKNLEAYYKGMRWHSGPHWFVAPDGIWEFCDPLQDGVHCSCANHVAFGCEMVGDYATEPFDHGPGAQVRDNAVQLIATVFKRFAWRPDPLVLWERGLAFHHHCAQDHHDCPGKNVDRADVVARVLKAMGLVGLDAGVPRPAQDLPAPVQSSSQVPTSVTWLQTALNRLGARPVLTVDGVFGPLTKVALRSWQLGSDLLATGEPSPMTVAAIERALHPETRA